MRPEVSIELAPYTTAWCHASEAEAKALRSVLDTVLIELHHIGSTAIQGIVAKPVIDMLGVVTSLEAVDAADTALLKAGYVPKGENGITGRRYFQKSNTVTGQRTHHLHLYPSGSPHIERHVAFRDYLRAHPQKAAEYNDLKRRILAEKPLSRTAYQDLKAPFILATEAMAVEWHRQRPPAPARSDKACPVIYRRRDDRIEVLAFRHPTAGLQFVKGSIEPGEDPETAARRELKEESGISLADPMAFIGAHRLGEQQRLWYFYLTEVADLPDRWSHQTEDDDGHVFDFFWHPLSENLTVEWHPLFHEMFSVIQTSLFSLHTRVHPSRRL